MKKLKQLGTFMICIIAALLITNCTVNAETPMLLHMKFDNNFIDQVSGANMDNYGNIKFVSGVSGKAAYFDGNGDYLNLGTGYNLTGDFTLSVWVKPESEDRRYAGLFEKYERKNYGPYAAYLTYNRPTFWVSDGYGGHGEYISDTKLLSSKWYLLTYVYKKNERKLTMYINGRFDTSFEYIDLVISDDMVTIGRQAYMHDRYSDFEYKGYLDDLRLYSSALSSANVLKLYEDFTDTVKLNKTSIGLNIGNSYKLTVSGTSKKITWKSSNSSVAAVDQKGKVVGTKAGKAVITASNGKITAKCNVTVSKISKAYLKTLKNNNGAISLTWNKVSGIDGYQIYQKYGNGSYKLYKKVSKSQTKLTIKNVKGGNYRYKIRTYKKVNGMYIYSDFSKEKKATVQWINIGESLLSTRKTNKLREIAGKIGGMKISYTRKYPNLYAAGNNMIIAVSENANYPNNYIYIKNSGNKRVSCLGVRLGMTPLQADTAVRKAAPYAYYYYGGYRFGDAASLELKYNKSGVVSGYTYILAPTS